MIAPRLLPLESNAPLLRVLCVRSFPIPQLAAQPNSFRAFPQSHLSVLTARHSCALPSLSKVEKNKEKWPLAANPFRIRSFVKRARNPFRMRTFKIQDLKPFRMCSSEKTRGGGVGQESYQQSRPVSSAPGSCVTVPPVRPTHFRGAS